MDGWRTALAGDPIAAALPDPVEAGQAGEGTHRTLVAAWRLQRAADPRAAIAGWFARVAPDGHLVLVVPHAFLHERQLALPSPWDPRQRRLYSPRVLLDEVEEALAPNSYRVRHLADLDAGYDYAAPIDRTPTGQSAVLLVLQRIAPPAWAPRLEASPGAGSGIAAEPDYRFEPVRTRVEAVDPALAAVRRLFLLKPDHLGDFLMGLPALQRLRALFPHAHITLLVGTWNLDLARALGVADEVIGFDIYPRNSSEEEVDVNGQAGLFRRAVTGTFDLAIDLRTDTDTRFLLRWVDTRLRAGIGTRAQFPYLDIALPLDFNRNWTEAAQETRFDHHPFAAQGAARRGDYRVEVRGDAVDRGSAIIWGPYRRLRAGRYLFDAHVEIAPDQTGLLLFDIALDTRRVARRLVDRPGPVRLAFEVEAPEAEFEFRVWTVDQDRPLDFSFYGGRLVREGADSVLHQSEYPQLLAELVALRLGRTGLLAEAGTAP